MEIAPNPSEIFQRAVKEGERRLDQTLLELTATAFIAGFTIVFGLIGLGIVRALLNPLNEGLATVVAAAAFGIGVVFLIVGRAELFSENFYDPLATLAQRRRSGLLPRLGRLWVMTFLLNLLGGGLFAWLLAVPGVLPEGTAHELAKLAEDVVKRGAWAEFVKAVVGGALVVLLSFLLSAVNSVGGRAAAALAVGFLLALGTFEHVIVSVLHVLFGILFGAAVTWADLFHTMAVATAGNLVGGVGLVALTHIAQAKGAEAAGE